MHAHLAYIHRWGGVKYGNTACWVGFAGNGRCMADAVLSL
jgi:hypothetical protein